MFSQASTIDEATEDINFEVNELQEQRHKKKLQEQEIAISILRVKEVACANYSEYHFVGSWTKVVVGLDLEEAKVHFDPYITNRDLLPLFKKACRFDARYIHLRDKFGTRFFERRKY